MKTFKNWDESGLDFNEFCQKGDELDYELFEWMVCGCVASNYEDGVFSQNGEAYTSKETKNGETYYYETFKEQDGKYFYIGLRADMNKYKPRLPKH